MFYSLKHKAILIFLLVLHFPFLLLEVLAYFTIMIIIDKQKKGEEVGGLLNWSTYCAYQCHFITSRKLFLRSGVILWDGMRWDKVSSDLVLVGIL